MAYLVSVWGKPAHLRLQGRVVCLLSRPGFMLRVDSRVTGTKKVCETRLRLILQTIVAQ